MADSIKDNLDLATELLKSNNIKTARLDSLVLLSKVTNFSKAKILAHEDLLLSNKQQNLFNDLITKRAGHIPVTQLTNVCEFYGRNFYVNESVMSPRPETEKMIDLLIELVNQNNGLKGRKNIHIADIGTGSGAIGITTKLEVPKVDVDLIDIDRKALKIAKINVVLNTIDLKILHSNLLEDISKKYDILLCNLPYIPDGMEINLEAMHEPKKAIFGGKDGLNIYRKLFRQVGKLQNKPLLILTEALPLSHKELIQIAVSVGYKQHKEDDFIQVFKLA